MEEIYETTKYHQFCEKLLDTLQLGSQEFFVFLKKYFKYADATLLEDIMKVFVYTLDDLHTAHQSNSITEIKMVEVLLNLSTEVIQDYESMCVPD